MPDPHLLAIVESATQGFQRLFHSKPSWIAAAPGRVNLIGEHTDYNDGLVLPMAIQRYTALAAATNPEPRLRIHSQNLETEVIISLEGPVLPGEPQWANYLRGVVAGFQRRNLPLHGLDICLASSVPVGGGLSSSAALEVSMATLLEAVTGHALDLVEKALLCLQAEHEFAGVPCGIMDQFISTLAREDHVLRLDCRDRTFEFVPLRDPDVSVLILNTNVHHDLASGEYALRRAQCENAARVLGVSTLRETTLANLELARTRLDPTIYRRARHVLTENERVLRTVEHLKSRQWTEAGELLYASHDSLRDDYEVSCRELDCLVEIARGLGEGRGVYGCRMTGGGFGGCAVALIQSARADLLSRHFQQEYQHRTGRAASAFISRPAAGARCVPVACP